MPPKWRKTADMKKLCHCHPMYIPKFYKIYSFGVHAPIPALTGVKLAWRSRPKGETSVGVHSSMSYVSFTHIGATSSL